MTENVEKGQLWVIAKLVFWRREKDEVFEKSPNGCQHWSQWGSEDAKT
jgi:hypothetical protein